MQCYSLGQDKTSQGITQQTGAHAHDFVEGQPHIDEIYWHVIPDAASRSVAFESGQIDVLPGGSVDGVDMAGLKGAELRRERQRVQIYTRSLFDAIPGRHWRAAS